MDSKLTWGIHLEVKCRKFAAALWQLRRALGRNWGLKPVAMKWLFDAILKSRLTYAAVVWWNRTLLKTAEGQLKRLRGLVLRCVTGSGRSTPTAALGTALCMEPLHLTIAAAAARGLLRLD